MSADLRWPRIGQRVDVHVDDDTLLAVVDDTRPPDQLHLREPVRLDGSPGPSGTIGTSLRLGWPAPTGYHVLPVRLTGVPEVRGRLWRLLPLGDVEVLQRREFVRVRDSLAVVLHREGSSWPASVCDLSEGGARCVLTDCTPLEEGDHVQMEAEINGESIRVDARVVAVEAMRGSTTGARLRFAELRHEGDVLRRRVLDVQRRARALERM